MVWAFALTHHSIWASLRFGSRCALAAHPPNTFTAPLFEPNGQLLIEYNADAAQWPTDVASWECFAWRVAGRDLTRAEWHNILPTRPYMHVCG